MRLEGPLTEQDIPESQKMAISSLRSRQVRNLMALMMLSREYLILRPAINAPHTNGNNNTWDQDKLNMIELEFERQKLRLLPFHQNDDDLRQSHASAICSRTSLYGMESSPTSPTSATARASIAWQVDPTKSGAKPLIQHSIIGSRLRSTCLTVSGSDLSYQPACGPDIVDPNQATFINKTYTIQPRSGIVLEERK